MNVGGDVGRALLAAGMFKCLPQLFTEFLGALLATESEKNLAVVAGDHYGGNADNAK